MIQLTFRFDILNTIFVNPAHIVSFFEFNGSTHVFTLLHNPLIEEDEGIIVNETPAQISHLIAQATMYHGTASL
tara:strand:+ start:233 stop:454 length:222 start_codon:yes stop_codon:yes gene_type:complete